MSLVHHLWLAEQLPEWEREGLVTAEAARVLRDRYRSEPQAGLAQMIVGALGALLIGTGLISVLAYNWDDFPRWVRLLLALGPLAASQGSSLWVLQRGETAKAWMREAAALVQALAAGAAMALVSQIYNLQGKWTDLIFWWCVVSLPLAWVLRSHAVAIAYLLGIAVWAIAESTGASFFRGTETADLRLLFPLLLAGVLPLWPGPTLESRPPVGSRFVLAASALLGLFAVASQVVHRFGQGLFGLAMLTSAVVLLFPLDRRGVTESLTRKPQVLLGGLALVLMALAATYEYPARDLVRGVGPAFDFLWCWLLMGVGASFAGLAAWQGRFAVLAVASLALVPLLAHLLTPPNGSGWPVAMIYSLVLLATAVVLIALEFLGRQGAARIGASLITILVILRMMDADMSLLAKGIAFIVIGCGFLSFNAFISRRRSVMPGGAVG